MDLGQVLTEFKNVQTGILTDMCTAQTRLMNDTIQGIAQHTASREQALHDSVNAVITQMCDKMPSMIAATAAVHTSTRVPFRLDLPTYDGTDNVNVWIRRLTLVFETTEVDGEMTRGNWARNALRGLAAQYVESLAVTEWKDIKEKLRERFLPANQEIFTREQLYQLRQTGNFNAYVRDFQALLLQLTVEPAEEDKIFLFLHGLHANTRGAVLQSQPTTLQNAIEKAIIMEHVVDNSRNTPTRVSFNPHAAPMDLDVVHSFRRGNARGNGSNRRPNRFQRGNRPAPRTNSNHSQRSYAPQINYANSNARDAPHSYASQRPSTSARCYNCNRYGHFARDCRAPQRRSPSRPLMHLGNANTRLNQHAENTSERFRNNFQRLNDSASRPGQL